MAKGKNATNTANGQSQTNNRPELPDHNETSSRMPFSVPPHSAITTSQICPNPNCGGTYVGDIAYHNCTKAC